MPQVDQAVHEPALLVVEKLPAAHAEQTRSLVLVPAVATYCPAGQVVIAVQEEAPAAE